MAWLRSSSNERTKTTSRKHAPLQMLPLMLLLACSLLRTATAHPEPHPKGLFPLGRVRVLMESDVRITLNVTQLTMDEQPVEVVVSGVTRPSVSDLVRLAFLPAMPVLLIAAVCFCSCLHATNNTLHNTQLAVYAPADADPARVVPVRWVPLGGAASASVMDGAPQKYAATGTARVVLRLPNHRADLRVRLLRGGGFLPGGSGPPVIVAGESLPIRNAIVAAPTQGHLGMNDAGQYVVSWVSGARQGQAVRWAIQPADAPSPPWSLSLPLWLASALWASEQAAPSPSPATYGAADLCGAPANSTGFLDPGWLHHVAVPRAVPSGARLWYRFGSDSGGWSEIYSAAGQPQSGASARVLVFNDVGMTRWGVVLVGGAR
jgi:hypothetical protein